MEKEDLLLKGLNFGYLAAKLEPELANTLIAILKDAPSEYAEGFRLGAKELDMEKQLENDKYLFPGMDELSRFDLDPGMDKDEIDLEPDL